MQAIWVLFPQKSEFGMTVGTNQTLQVIYTCPLSVFTNLINRCRTPLQPFQILITYARSSTHSHELRLQNKLYTNWFSCLGINFVLHESSWPLKPFEINFEPLCGRFLVAFSMNYTSDVGFYSGRDRWLLFLRAVS